MKKVIKSLIISLMVVGLTAGFGFTCDGPDCGQTSAYANPISIIQNAAVTAPGSSDWAGGKAIGDVKLEATASSSGADSYERVKDYYVKGYWTGKPWRSEYVWGYWVYKTELVPGESEAIAKTDLGMSSDVDVFTNGPQHTGVSFTYVKTDATLNIDGFAKAEGTDGCFQAADIQVGGDLTAFTYGNSLSIGPNGSYAEAHGEGATTIGFEGWELDFQSHSNWGPNKAEVDFSSNVNVDQELFVASYVSKDGMTSANFGIVGGGDAELKLGSDATLCDWFDKDNIKLTDIKSSGYVSQYGAASDGLGSVATGFSTSYFNNGIGVVNPIQFTFCGPDQTANGTGLAVVAGYNNITKTPGSLNVTSIQYGYATTGSVELPVSQQLGGDY